MVFLSRREQYNLIKYSQSIDDLLVDGYVGEFYLCGPYSAICLTMPHYDRAKDVVYEAHFAVPIIFDRDAGIVVLPTQIGKKDTHTFSKLLNSALAKAPDTMEVGKYTMAKDLLGSLVDSNLPVKDALVSRSAAELFLPEIQQSLLVAEFPYIEPLVCYDLFPHEDTFIAKILTRDDLQLFINSDTRIRRKVYAPKSKCGDVPGSVLLRFDRYCFTVAEGKYKDEIIKFNGSYMPSQVCYMRNADSIAHTFEGPQTNVVYCVRERDIQKTSTGLVCTSQPFDITKLFSTSLSTCIKEE